MNYKDRQALEQAYSLILEGKGVPCPCKIGKKCTNDNCKCPACKKAKAHKKTKSLKEATAETVLSGPELVTEFNAPEEAQAILDDPNQPTGTLPHSMEAVLQELAFWGQHGHQRVMDPEIADLATQLADLIRTKSKQTNSSNSKAKHFRP